VNPEELIKVVNGLSKQTESADLKWRLFGNTEDEFTTETEKFRFYVGSRDDDGELPLKFEIWAVGEKGIKIGDFLTSNIPSATGAIQRLHSVARASAAGIEGSIADAVLRDLGELF
jgi:hypothetical protein